MVSEALRSEPVSTEPSPTPEQLREELVELALRDLLGPFGGEEEILDVRDITSRYLVGRLAPTRRQHPIVEAGALPEATEAIEPQGDEGDEDDEHNAPLPGSLFPSAIGLSFVISGEATHLKVRARWGIYKRVKNPSRLLAAESSQPNEAEENSVPTTAIKPAGSPMVWKRQQIDDFSAPIPLVEGKIEPWLPDPLQPEVLVRGLVRPRRGQWHVTLWLVNEQQEPKETKGTAWLFQPELHVESPDGAPIFEKRPEGRAHDQAELAALAMRYRRRLQFAVGHNVSAKVTLQEGEWNRATRISTDVVPTYDTPVADTPTVSDIPALASVELDMRKLAAIPDGEFGSHLSPLLGAYSEWIERLRKRAASEPDLAAHKDAADGAIRDCEVTLRRIAAGIALLDTDPNAAKAFRFANAAMADQRVHSEHARNVRQGKASNLETIEAKASSHTWRVFQLAFILLNISGVTDPTHGDRNDYADLLFFPTGGGKTEAYLGLAAYVIVMRRLQGKVAGRSGEAGIAVLMRYTLRLLTLQQFQRAATLLCACEIMRKRDVAQWGTTPFAVGLWVGARTTPNRVSDSEEAVRAYKNSGYLGSGTPHQLTNCPWCGHAIDPGKDIDVENYEQGAARTFIYCGNFEGDCPFSRKHAPRQGLPILTVDEEIYRRLPSLLIATVDKFAQMPWNGQTGMLFGQVTGYCDRHGYCSPELDCTETHKPNKTYRLEATRRQDTPPLRPPDLIIQDELHLISGPLGSLVGLYETAVDELCTWEYKGVQVRPKVIASTATIRQATLQVKKIFARRLHVFPSPGLDIEDSFFALERPTTERSGRRYLGICAHGERHRTGLIRIYVTMMAAAQQLYEKYGEASGAALDPWLTLVGYFNSLRELGAMRRSVDDSVRARLRRTDRRGLTNRHIDEFTVEELTSRKDATDIPAILDRLEQKFGPPQPRTVPIKKREARQLAAKGQRPYDVLLATNMISVGVDVSRLGLMVVGGQPKNTAEYIQSTSRVGRSDEGPGIVVVAYNWTRPRDLSHYESFAHYHATAYQHVEALSVTPFSTGAIDRGLSGILTAAVRLVGSDLNKNESAGNFTKRHPFATAATAAIKRRAEDAEDIAQAAAVERAIKLRLDEWAMLITQNQSANISYKKRSGTQQSLLSRPEDGPWQLFTVLNSLRDVEPTARLILNPHAIRRTQPSDWRFEKTSPDEELEDNESANDE